MSPIATRTSAALRPKLLRHDLRQRRADAAADILNRGEQFHRSVAADSHLAGGVEIHDAVPDRLRHAEPALDRTVIRTGRVT